MKCPSCEAPNLPGNEQCSNCHQSLSVYDQIVPTNHVEKCVMEHPVAALKPREPVLVGPDTTLREAMGLMLDHNVGAVLVVDAAGQLAGIFTERDLLKRVAGVHAEYHDLPVKQFMTPRPDGVAPGATLNYVLQRMDARGYRHVPVVEGGKPVGILSVRAMLRYIVELCKE